MSTRSIGLSETLHRYLLEVSVREPQLLARLREETAALPDGQMQVAPEQGQFLALLVGAIGARRLLEVGVFTGYSSLCMARALPEGGSLVACDVNREWTGIAHRYWREAGVESRIDLRIGPAIETLDGLLEAGEAGTYDLMFIDADKENYGGYYARGLKLVRTGGLILVDNVLWGGSVADDSDQSPRTVSIRNFNDSLRDDSRIDLSMVPIGDGITLARKR